MNAFLRWLARTEPARVKRYAIYLTFVAFAVGLALAIVAPRGARRRGTAEMSDAFDEMALVFVVTVALATAVEITVRLWEWRRGTRKGEK